MWSAEQQCTTLEMVNAMSPFYYLGTWKGSQPFTLHLLGIDFASDTSLELQLWMRKTQSLCSLELESSSSDPS